MRELRQKKSLRNNVGRHETRIKRIAGICTNPLDYSLDRFVLIRRIRRIRVANAQRPSHYERFINPRAASTTFSTVSPSSV